jgi:hypothetical protein
MNEPLVVTCAVQQQPVKAIYQPDAGVSEHLQRIMKWNVSFDRVRKIVKANQYGKYTLEEQNRFLRDIVAAECWQPGLPLLIDYRYLDVSTVGREDIEVSAKTLREMGESFSGSKIALLCRREVQYGLGRQLQIYCDGMLDAEIAVFREKLEALNWLKGRN